MWFAMSISMVGALCALQAHAAPLAPPSTKPSEATAVPYTVHGGYHLMRQLEMRETSGWAVVRDRKAFDALLAAPVNPGGQSERLPADAFETKIVLVAGRVEKAIYAFKVDGVTARDGVVTINYSATKTSDLSAPFPSTLIVAIPAGPHQAVEFAEGGKVVHRVAMGK
jgi:hypothetical protein